MVCIDFNEGGGHDEDPALDNNDDLPKTHIVPSDGSNRRVGGSTNELPQLKVRPNVLREAVNRAANVPPHSHPDLGLVRSESEDDGGSNVISASDSGSQGLPDWNSLIGENDARPVGKVGENAEAATERPPTPFASGYFAARPVKKPRPMSEVSKKDGSKPSMPLSSSIPEDEVDNGEGQLVKRVEETNHSFQASKSSSSKSSSKDEE